LYNPKHDRINIAYNYYTVAQTVSKVALVKDLMVLARSKGVDCFNTLDVMDNRQMLEELKFEQGSGNLHYYLYNWKCRDLEEHETALILP
jgi:glycylpeptide N-tetradecanoyltransferase